MAVPAPTASQAGVARDHGFHPLRIKRVVGETAEAASFVLEVQTALHQAYDYQAGQFLTFRVVIDGVTHLRCYSMSSSPEVDTELQVTVKRVPGGVVSNWMIDVLVPGAEIETTCPAGVFVLPPGDDDIVAFAAGSGITPVFSLIKTALATTARRVRLLYANRDRDAVIFAAELDRLAQRHPARFDVVHHLDVEKGFVGPDELRPFVEDAVGADAYLCGPTAFMNIVEHELLTHGLDAACVHIERFTPAAQPETPAAQPETPAAPDPVDAVTTSRVTISLDGRTETTHHHPGTTILQAARQMGMSPPYSCESGSCASCMAKLVEGAVSMRVNDALTDDEVADGWVLTCQSVPQSPSVRVVYGYEDG
jgi:3-ketosteroid 9alpha-monooxygenase subunit B